MINLIDKQSPEEIDLTPNVMKKEIEPPDVLYYGTDPKIIQTIFEEGLNPIFGQYIHLTVDIKTARKIGQIKCDFPAILVINAKKAFDDGIKFYLGNENIWLADYIPSKYIK
jgi:putative RNA 2'-phosphotransferase